MHQIGSAHARPVTIGQEHQQRGGDARVGWLEPHRLGEISEGCFIKALLLLL
jgi:hypothetical protein